MTPPFIFGRLRLHVWSSTIFGTTLWRGKKVADVCSVLARLQWLPVTQVGQQLHVVHQRSSLWTDVRVAHTSQASVYFHSC